MLLSKMHLEKHVGKNPGNLPLHSAFNIAESNSKEAISTTGEAAKHDKIVAAKTCPLLKRKNEKPAVKM